MRVLEVVREGGGEEREKAGRREGRFRKCPEDIKKRNEKERERRKYPEAGGVFLRYEETW